MIPLLLLACAGTFGYSHLEHKIDNTRTQQSAAIVELRTAENDTRSIVNKHTTQLASNDERLTALEGVVPGY